MPLSPLGWWQRRKKASAHEGRRRSVTLHLEHLEARQLFSVSPLLPHPLTPVQGTQASNSGSPLSAAALGPISPSVRAGSAFESTLGTFTLEALGSYGFAFHLDGYSGTTQFSLDATGTTAFHLLQNGSDSNGGLSVSSISLDQTGLVSFHFHETTNGVVVRDESRTDAFNLHDPGAGPLDPVQWYAYNWAALTSDLSSRHSYSLEAFTWAAFNLSETGGETFAFHEAGTKQVGRSASALLNAASSGDNTLESGSDSASATFLFDEAGQGTFALLEAGGWGEPAPGTMSQGCMPMGAPPTGPPGMAIPLTVVDYREGGSDTWAFHQDATHSFSRTGSDLANSIVSNDSVSAFSAQESQNQSGTSSATWDQSGAGSYALHEAGSGGMGSVVFPQVDQHETATGTFADREAGTGSLSASDGTTDANSDASRFDAGAANGNGAHATERSGSASTGSTTQSGPVSFAFAESGTFVSDLSQQGSYTWDHFALATSVLQLTSTSTFTLHQTSSAAVTGGAQDTSSGSALDTNSDGTPFDAGYGSLGSSSQSGTDSSSFASGDSLGLSGTATATLDQSGHTSSTLHEEATGTGGLGCFVLDQSGQSTWALHRQEGLAETGNESSSDQGGGSASGASGGASSFAYGAPGAPGSTSAGSSSTARGAGASSTFSDTSNYQFTAPVALVFDQTGSNSYVLHQEGNPDVAPAGPVTFALDQVGASTFTNHREETRQVSNGSASGSSWLTAQESFGLNNASNSGTNVPGQSSLGSASVSALGSSTANSSDTYAETFAGTVSSVLDQSGGSSFALHEEGLFLAGALSLSSYSLSRGSASTFARSESASLTGSGTENRQHSASSSDSLALGAAGGNAGSGRLGLDGSAALNLGGTATLSAGSGDTTTASGTESDTTGSTQTTALQQSGGESYSLFQAGTFAGGSYSLSSYSLSQGAASTFAYHEDLARSASGTQTETLDRGGWGNGQDTGAGSFQAGGTARAPYSGTNTYALARAGTQQELAQSNYADVAGEAGTFADGSALHLDRSGGESYALRQVGSYANGSFNLSTLTLERSGQSTFASTESGLDSWSGTATDSFSAGGSDSGTAGDTGVASGAGSQQFGLSAASESSSGNDSVTAGQNSTFGASSGEGLAESGTQSSTLASSGADSFHLFEAGQYGNGSLSLACLSLDRGGSDTFALQETDVTSDTGWKSESSQAQGLGSATQSGAGNFGLGALTSQALNNAGNSSSALASHSAGGTTTASAGGLTSFASTAGESYALSSVETLTLAEGGGDTFAWHEDGSFSAGSLSLASFSESEQSGETFAKHDALTESLLNGTGSSTLHEGSSANEASSGTSGDTFSGSSQDSLAAGNSYSSGSTSTTGYQASGDPGHSGTSTYGYGGQDSLGANGSSTSAGGSAGTSSANGSATSQEDATSSYAFAASDTRTGDESGGSSFVLFEAGSAAAGAFSLTSYSMDERSSDTFSMHEQDVGNTTGSAHDATSGTGSGNSQAGANGSSSFAGGGRASFLAATGSSTNSGSQSANDQGQATATSTRDETFADGSSLTQDQSGGESYHLFEAGVYANGSLSLGCISMDESASSTFASSESLSDARSGTESSAESGSGLGSYSGAGLGSLGFGSVGTYGSGGTSTSSLGAAGSFARGGNESYLFDASSSDSFGSTDAAQDTETGADSFALHEEGNFANGSVNLSSYALSEGSADSFASHEQGNESQTNGSVQGHVQQSGSGSGSESGSSNSSSAAVGLTGLGSAGTQSASSSGSWSQASGESYGYAFGDGQTFSLDDSGTNSLSLYEGGAYSNGSLSLSSYQLQESGSDTFAENDQSSEQVSNGQDATTFADQGSAAGGQLGTGGYGFNAGGVAGVAGTSSSSQGGTGSQSDSGGQTTTLARTDSALNVRSGGDNYALQQAGQWSLGSYALNVYRLDESASETFAASQTETDTTGGSAAESFGSSAQGSATSGDQTGYAGTTTQSGGSQGTSQQADSAGETWAFAGVETATAGQSGGDSFALHEDGNFANGSLALSSYALSEGASETFSTHDASSGTFGGGDTSGSNASGADAFARGAGAAYQFGGPGTWSSASAQSTTFTGAGSSTLDETGGQGQTEQESGTYGNGTLSLQSLSYGGWSADSYASHEGAAQSPTMTGASGGESERQDGAGLDSASYAGSGQYANGSLSLNALRYDEESTQSATEHADGNPVEAGGSDAFVQDDVAGSHWLLHEAGGYGPGGLSLSSYGYEQDSTDSFAAHDAAQESTSSDTGQQTADDTSASSYALSESGSYAQGSFALTNYQDNETSSARQTSSTSGSHAAGTESLAWTRSADEQVRENLLATGAYNNGRLQLVSYAKGSSDDATGSWQETASDGTSTEVDSGDQAHHETDAVTGTGAWGTEAQQASDTSDTHQKVTGPNAFLSNVDATGGSGTSNQTATPLPQQQAPPPLADEAVPEALEAFVAAPTVLAAPAADAAPAVALPAAEPPLSLADRIGEAAYRANNGRKVAVFLARLSSDDKALLAVWLASASAEERAGFFEDMLTAAGSLGQQMGDVLRDSIGGPLKRPPPAGMVLPPAPAPMPPPAARAAPLPPPPPARLPPPRPAPAPARPVPPPPTAEELKQWEAEAREEQRKRDAWANRVLKQAADDAALRRSLADGWLGEARAMRDARARGVVRRFFGAQPHDLASPEELLKWEHARRAMDPANWEIRNGVPIPITPTGRRQQERWAQVKEIAGMSAAQKLGRALQRAHDGNMLSNELKAQVTALLEPENLAKMGVIMAAVGASTFTPAGPFVMSLAGVVGYIMLGASVIDVSHDLYMFATTAMGARSDSDFDNAAQHFSRGIAKAALHAGTAATGAGVGKSLSALKGVRKPATARGNRVEVAPKPAAAPASGGEWVKPPRWQLPKKGTWEGTPGNSNFKPNNPAQLGLKPGEVIPFRNGRPDFSKWHKGTFTSKEALSGDPVADRTLMIKTIAEKKGWTHQQVKDWIQQKQLSLHHAGGKEIQLIPWKLHGNRSAKPAIPGLTHQGGAYDLRTQ